ncbi:MAG: S1C family serine protease [Pseudolabrys sp.]
MVDRTNILAQFSSALVERSVAANSAIAAIRLREGRHMTGMLWRPDAVITSEQSLPEREEFELLTADGSAIKAKMAGRDPGTNLAALKPERPLTVATAIPAASHVGALAIAFGADAGGTATPRLGVVNAIGPEWHSSHGGRIEQRVELDIDLARREEGGPVFDASGRLLGMSTFGPRRQVIIIPAATIERVVPILLKDGRVSRGWLGVGLRPVAVPEGLGDGQSSGLMVMSLAAGGPAANAGIVVGDIVLSVDGVSARRMRNITARLGTDSIGRTIDLRFIRGGLVTSRQAMITERPNS